MGCVRNWADSFFYLFWTKMFLAMAGCTCVQAVSVGNSSVHFHPVSAYLYPILNSGG